jgi:CelD/BcsL family acetyltransferase involved in cellulose biosynthesis
VRSSVLRPPFWFIVYYRLATTVGLQSQPARHIMSAVKPLSRKEAETPHVMPDTVSTAPLIDVRLEIHRSLSEVERDWCKFEQEADATAFQSFAWLATWQSHVGSAQGVLPVIIIGRDERHNILFLLPFAISSMGFVHQLTWLGSELCDYNAPLLAPGVSARLKGSTFGLLWQRIVQRLRCETDLQFDLINLEKMPDRVGAQCNPMRAVVSPTPQRRVRDPARQRLGNIL